MPTVLDRIAAAVTGDDAERLAKRREIKQQLANLEAVQGRHRAIGHQIGALGVRENKAVAEHQKTCAPIQQQLQDIEAEITNAIVADEPVSDRLTKQRADALEKLADANSKLEAEVESIKKLRHQLEQDRGKLTHQISEIPKLRGQLTARGVADPELLLQRFALTQDMVWGERRLREARRELQSAENALRIQEKHREQARIETSAHSEKRDPQPDEFEIRAAVEVEQWQAELDAAHAALDAATEAREQLRQQILDE